MPVGTLMSLRCSTAALQLLDVYKVCKLQTGLHFMRMHLQHRIDAGY